MLVHWPSVRNHTVPQPLMRAFQWTIVEAVLADDDLFLLVLPLRYCIETRRCTSDKQVNLILWLDVYGLNNIHAYKVNQLTISLTFRQTDKGKVQPTDNPPSQLSYCSTAALTEIQVAWCPTLTDGKQSFCCFMKADCRVTMVTAYLLWCHIIWKNGRKSGSWSLEKKYRLWNVCGNPAEIILHN